MKNTENVSAEVATTEQEEKVEVTKVEKVKTWVKANWKVLAKATGVAVCMAAAFAAGKNSGEHDEVDDYEDDVIDVDYEEVNEDDTAEKSE